MTLGQEGAPLSANPFYRSVENKVEASPATRLWWLVILASSLLGWGLMLLGAGLLIRLLA